MNFHCSKVSVVSPVPVSISIVTICDLRVLVNKYGDSYYFPYGYINNVKDNVQKEASNLLRKCINAEQKGDKWLPVDIRTGERENIDGVSTLDIGYMTILDSVDLPNIKFSDMEWVLVNLDEKKFPGKLCMDHDSLWKASVEMFSIMR